MTHRNSNNATTTTTTAEDGAKAAEAKTPDTDKKPTAATNKHVNMKDKTLDPAHELLELHPSSVQWTLANFIIGMFKLTKDMRDSQCGLEKAACDDAMAPQCDNVKIPFHAKEKKKHLNWFEVEAQTRSTASGTRRARALCAT